LPTFFFFIGPVFDSFGQKKIEETRDDVHEICLIMLALALTIMTTSFSSNFLLMHTGEKVTAKLKTKYLEAIINQESAWFDIHDFLASQIDRDIEIVRNGIGQKFG